MSRGGEQKQVRSQSLAPNLLVGTVSFIPLFNLVRGPYGNGTVDDHLLTHTQLLSLLRGLISICPSHHQFPFDSPDFNTDWIFRIFGESTWLLHNHRLSLLHTCRCTCMHTLISVPVNKRHVFIRRRRRRRGVMSLYNKNSSNNHNKMNLFLLGGICFYLIQTPSCNRIGTSLHFNK